MAEGRIDIKEDAAPTKFLASQTHLHGADTVHAEEVVIVDAAGVIVGQTANRLNVDGSGVTQPVSDAGGALTVDALDLDIRNLVAATDKVGATIDGPLGGGVEAGAVRVTVASDSTGLLSVDDNGGSLTVDGTVTSNVGTGTRPVAGDVAHDGVDSGNPVKIGAKASGALPTAVAAADRTDAYFDREGRQIIRPWGAGAWAQVNFPAANTRASSTKAAGAAGVRHVCTGLTVVLAAGATAPAAIQLDVRVRDGILDTGTILWQAVVSLPATAGAMNGIALSGLNILGSAATAMTIEFSAAGGANTFESVAIQGVDITEA